VPTPADRCTLRSEARDEVLAGTASTVARWLLVESPGPWGPDGLLDGRLAGAAGRALHDLGRGAGVRVLLIRRADRRAEPGRVSCFSIDAGAPVPWIGRRALASIDEAPDLDLDDPGAFEAVDGPLAVICTHGRRDVCCAERGRPLARATAAAFPSSTWESTHVGGDRFAANLVLFPHTLFFGRVEAVRGPEIVREYAAGRIVLERFRGRGTVPMFAQAAEAHVRQASGLRGIDDVLVTSARRAGDLGEVRLVTPDGERLVRVRRVAGEPMRLTCRSEADEAPVSWRVVDEG
jgi:hypothetical protein